MDERGSLDNLRDIAIPESPSLWPPAPEAWVVIAVAILGVGVVVYRWQRQQRANAYRRAGLSLLDDAGTLHDISVILKRVALVAFPRDQVASLYGEEWVAFLGRTCDHRDFTALAQGPDDRAADGETRQLAALWIERHRNVLSAGGD